MCSRQRQQKTRSLVQDISGMKIVPGLLPDNDKRSIMEWLLQRTRDELTKLYADDDTPLFVVKCIELLRKRPITAYAELMQSFKCNDNEGSPADKHKVGFAQERKAV